MLTMRSYLIRNLIDFYDVCLFQGQLVLFFIFVFIWSRVWFTKVLSLNTVFWGILYLSRPLFLLVHFISSFYCYQGWWYLSFILPSQVISGLWKCILACANSKCFSWPIFWILQLWWRFFHEIVERILEFMEAVEKLATRDILTVLRNAMLPKTIYI